MVAPQGRASRRNVAHRRFAAPLPLSRSAYPWTKDNASEARWLDGLTGIDALTAESVETRRMTVRRGGASRQLEESSRRVEAWPTTIWSRAPMAAKPHACDAGHAGQKRKDSPCNRQLQRALLARTRRGPALPSADLRESSSSRR